MDFIELLRAYGPDIWDSRIRLVRHRDTTYDLELLYRTGYLDQYECHQARPVFGDAEFILSFLGERGTRSRFVGCRRVLGERRPRKSPPGFPYPQMTFGPHCYELEPVKGFEKLEDRLVIDWGSATRAWVQRFPPRTPKEVIEVLPKGHVSDFSGYDEVILSFHDLERMIQNPDANRTWHLMLKSVAGIYLITDQKRGDQYIGSASGKAGLLGRWTSYVATKHGGNKELKALLKKDPERFVEFQFSILRTLPRTMTPKEVVTLEAVYKKKLGTRAHGLNAN